MKNLALFLGIFALTFAQMSFANQTGVISTVGTDTTVTNGVKSQKNAVLKFYTDFDNEVINPSAILTEVYQKSEEIIIQENNQIIGTNMESSVSILQPYQKPALEISLENNQIIGVE